jgi:DNA-binding PadR family transcriptional regulator
MLDMIIIGVVYDKPLTGYDIKKELEMGVGNFYKAGYGSLYPALARMATAGLLTMTEPEGGRKKKFYQATEEGCAKFMEWLDAPFDPQGGDIVLLKIYFFGRLSPASREKRLAELAGFVELSQHKLRALEAEVLQVYSEEEILNDDVGYFELSTLYYGIVNGYTTARWLAHLAARRPHRKFIEEREKENADSNKGSEFEKKLQIPRGFEGR